MLSKMISLMSVASALEPNPPLWDTERVLIFEPGNEAVTQPILDSIHATQGGQVPPGNGEFSDNRYALLFKQG
jgi:hypothetical protein